MISFVQAVHALRTCNHSTSPLRPLPPPWPQKTTKQDRKCPRSLHPQNPTSMFRGASSPPASQLGCGLHGHRPKRSPRLAPPPRLLASPSACGRWLSGSPSSLPGWCPRGTRFLALGSGTLSLPWVKSLSDADHPPWDRSGRGLLRGQGEEFPHATPWRWAREAGAPGRASWRRRPSVGTCVLQELVEYYQCHSLKESFKQLDTTLKYPYKSRERTASKASSRSPGNAHAHLAHRAQLEVCAPPCFPPPGSHCPPAPEEGFPWGTLTWAGSLSSIPAPGSSGPDPPEPGHPGGPR